MTSGLPETNPWRIGPNRLVEPAIAKAGGPVPYLAEELLYAITNQITYSPRSLQSRIGPSEYGIPCDRRIGYKVAGVEVINQGEPPWKQFIGTSTHHGLESIMKWFNGYLGVNEYGPRFLLEHKVNVGQICGDDIDGSCDLYDRLTGTVVDWKIVGEKQLKKYKTEGPGGQYRVQAHSYGKGWERRGVPVNAVAVFFLPRDRELREAHFWHEAYDGTVVDAALTRASAITTLVRQLGPETALPMLSTADNYCTFCPYFLPASTEVGEACPGHPGATGYLRS